MAKTSLDAPELFINRELSWLEFNDRVLAEGRSKDVPLIERLKFLAITSTNLDEFFMVRVAGLMEQRSARVHARDLSGLTPVQQLERIGARVRRMTAEHGAAVRECLEALAPQGVRILAPHEWTPAQREFLTSYFSSEVLPSLTPLAVEQLHPAPLLHGLELHVALSLASEADAQRKETIVVVPVPRLFPRFVTIPTERGMDLARIEDILAANAGLLAPRGAVVSAGAFRITLDASVEIEEEDEAGDLLDAVEEAVRLRRRRAAVRLEVSGQTAPAIKNWLRGWLGLAPEDVYEIDGLLDASSLMEIANRPGLEALRYPDWLPQIPRDFDAADDLWQTLQDHDILLFHPYDSFDPVVHFVWTAADDPSVLAIKQTLYRASGDSQIVRALQRAAESGKQVTVLVELRARFDEQRNVNWARRLEDAGCHVIYGIAGYKTHAKALLVIRREATGIRRYAHLATGNYNERTARQYSDIGLLTCHRDLTADVAAFFNLLTGYSEVAVLSRLSIAPTGLRSRFEELIEREIQTSTREQPGQIMAKVNSLQDKAICQALMRAAQAGVRVRLNVRGICCLRPGAKGTSDPIEVRSIVDRFLEHARVFYFRNGGHEEVYMSSADWMERNLDKRLEILFPVLDAGLRRRLTAALELYFADNTKASRLLPDGTYERVKAGGKPVRAQEALYQDSVEAARAAERAPARFRPLSRPKE
jgi:polyphosphate kinase